MKDSSTNNLLARAVHWAVVSSILILAYICIVALKNILLRAALLVLTELNVKDERPYKLLVRLGADIDLSVSNPERYTYHDLTIPIRYADKYNKINAMQALVKASKVDEFKYPDRQYTISNLFNIGPRSFTALHMAALEGNIKMINILLAARANVHIKDNAGLKKSAIFWALYGGHKEAADLLFTDTDKKTLPGHLPFFSTVIASASEGSANIVLSLMSEKQIPFPDYQVTSNTALHKQEHVSAPLLLCLGFRICETYQKLPPEQFISTIEGLSKLPKDSIAKYTWAGLVEAKAGQAAGKSSIEPFDELEIEEQRTVISHAMRFAPQFSLVRNFFCNSIDEAKIRVRDLLQFLGTTNCVCKDFKQLIETKGLPFIDVLLTSTFNVSVVTAKTAYYVSNPHVVVADVSTPIVKKAIDSSEKYMHMQRYPCLEARTIGIIDAFVCP